MGKFLLTLVRHGETEYNARGLLQGQIDIPLNETGLQQADALGRHLAEEKFDRIYSSDLTRCLQTANGVIKHSAVPRPDIIKDPRLRERSFGSHEGISREERARARMTNPPPPGEETVKQVVDRGLACLRDVCKDVHKAYNQNGELKSVNAAERPSRCLEDDADADADSGLEIVFAESAGGNSCEQNSGSTAQNDSSSGKNSTEISMHGTSDDIHEGPGNGPMNIVVAVPSPNSGVMRQANPASSSSTRDKVGETVVKEKPSAGSSCNRGAGVGGKGMMFKSEITGENSAPEDCPHILVSSHGFILRSVMQELQKKFKIDIPGGAGTLRCGCPNTGVNSFIVEVDGSGEINDIECLFVFNTDHLNVDKDRKL